MDARRMLGYVAEQEPEVEERIAELEKQWSEPRAGAPPRCEPSHWAEVARVYREAVADSRSPRRALQQHFPECKSTATARNWTSRARELGLLEPWENFK